MTLRAFIGAGLRADRDGEDVHDGHGGAGGGGALVGHVPEGPPARAEKMVWGRLAMALRPWLGNPAAGSRVLSEHSLEWEAASNLGIPGLDELPAQKRGSTSYSTSKRNVSSPDVADFQRTSMEVIEALFQHADATSQQVDYRFSCCYLEVPERSGKARSLSRSESDAKFF